MGLLVALLIAGLAVLVVAYVRAHPKPKDEPLPTYIDQTATGVKDEIVAGAETTLSDAENIRIP